MISSRSYQYRIGWLQRLPLRMPYPAIVTAIGSVMRRLPRDTTLLIDNTGIGRACFDLLRDAGASPLGIAITSGVETHREGTRVSVPKATLVGKLIALTQSRQLKVLGDLKEWPVLRRELQNFRPEITSSGRETWNAASGSHDDLIIATALCSWYLQGGIGGWGAPSPFLAAVAAGLGARAAEMITETFCVGVDLGQSIDNTAICVMSKLPTVPDPGRDGFCEKVEPEVPGYFVELPAAVAPTTSHPDVGGGPIEHVNGPHAQLEFARGSVEWAEQRSRESGV
jgi:hypothetical protein